MVFVGLMVFVGFLVFVGLMVFVDFTWSWTDGFRYDRSPIGQPYFVDKSNFILSGIEYFLFLPDTWFPVDQRIFFIGHFASS